MVAQSPWCVCVCVCVCVCIYIYIYVGCHHVCSHKHTILYISFLYTTNEVYVCSLYTSLHIYRLGTVCCTVNSLVYLQNLWKLLFVKIMWCAAWAALLLFLQLLFEWIWEHCSYSFFFSNLLCPCRWLHLTGSVLPQNVRREVVLQQVTADLPQLLLVGLIPVTSRNKTRKYVS